MEHPGSHFDLYSPPFLFSFSSAPIPQTKKGLFSSFLFNQLLSVMLAFLVQVKMAGELNSHTTPGVVAAVAVVVVAVAVVVVDGLVLI